MEETGLKQQLRFDICHACFMIRLIFQLEITCRESKFQRQNLIHLQACQEWRAYQTLRYRLAIAFQPDIVQLDVAVPSNGNIEQEAPEKLEKYQGLRGELVKNWWTMVNGQWWWGHSYLLVQEVQQLVCRFESSSCWPSSSVLEQYWSPTFSASQIGTFHGSLN